jgi:hypothetical protein
MTPYPKIIIRLVGISGVGFNNAKNHAEIKAQIAGIGYDEPKLDLLLALNSRTDVKYHEYEVKHGEQLHATKEMEAVFDEEMSFYSDYRRIAFQVFPGEEHKGIRSQLGIDVEIKRTFDGFIEQSKQLYDTTKKKNEILLPLGEFAVTTEKMQARLDRLETLRRLNEVQERKKGEAALALKERNDSFEELKTEWLKFGTACNIAFKDNPEYLKILNVDQPLRVRSKNDAEEPDDETGETPPPDQT